MPVFQHTYHGPKGRLTLGLDEIQQFQLLGRGLLPFVGQILMGGCSTALNIVLSKKNNEFLRYCWGHAHFVSGNSLGQILINFNVHDLHGAPRGHI